MIWAQSSSRIHCFWRDGAPLATKGELGLFLVTLMLWDVPGIRLRCRGVTIVPHHLTFHPMLLSSFLVHIVITWKEIKIRLRSVKLDMEIKAIFCYPSNATWHPILCQSISYDINIPNIIWFILYVLVNIALLSLLLWFEIAIQNAKRRSFHVTLCHGNTDIPVSRCLCFIFHFTGVTCVNRTRKENSCISPFQSYCMACTFL